MLQAGMRGWGRAIVGGSTLALILAVGPSEAAVAQIVPDNTLGRESSQVRNFGTVDAIVGGAKRGPNLFHSFSEFNVGDGRAAYFINSSNDLQNILSRVTGSNRSEILGTLGILNLTGVTSKPNLFLINPNGIVFGPNARLDINGSFVGTTANAIQFGTQGFFSATNPTAPPLLTVQPSAFLFNQITPSNIVVNTQAPLGLSVSLGQNLLLLGGNVTVDGGQLSAFGGRIEIGAVAGAGTVGLNADDSFSFPVGLPRGDVSFNNSQAYVPLDNKGNIGITANNINILNGSVLLAGIFPGGTSSSQAGDINLKATGNVQVGQASLISNDVQSGATGNGGNLNITAGSLSVTGDSQLSASTFGQGNAGRVIIRVADTAILQNSSVDSRVESGAKGNSGGIDAVAKDFSLTDGSQLNVDVLGEGQGGKLALGASELDLIGVSEDGQRRSALTAETYGLGRAGDLQIDAGQLNIRDGAIISANAVKGNQPGGNLTINASNINLIGTSQDGQNRSAISTETDSSGRAGDLRINTGQLTLQDGAIISANAVRGSQGRGGNLVVNASNVNLIGTSKDGQNRSAISAQTEGQEKGGSVAITTGQLNIRDGAGVIVSTFSHGQGGDLTINAASVTLTGTSSDRQYLSALGSETYGTGNAGNLRINTGQLTIQNGAIVSTRAVEGSQGQGGNITVQTDSLQLTNNAQLSATTSGQGIAGNISVQNVKSVSLDNSTISTAVSVPTLANLAAVQGGNINIQTQSLALTNGARITANTSGFGNAGSINITAPNRINVDGINSDGVPSSISSTVESTGIGRGGDVTLNTGILRVSNLATLNTSTNGQGDAGNIHITARNRAIFDSSSTIGAVNNAPLGGSNYRGGNISIRTGTLAARNGAQILTSTEGQGRAGDIHIRARGRVVFDGSDQSRLSSAAQTSVTPTGVGRAGNIDVRARELSLTNSGQLVSSTYGQGRAGNISVRVARNVRLDNGGLIQSAVFAGGRGNGGDVRVRAQSLSATNGSQIAAEVFRQQEQGEKLTPGGNGNGGNVRLDIAGSTVLSGIGETGFSSGLLTQSERGAFGRAGDITVNTDDLQVTNGAIVTAATFNPGGIGGDITINANTLEALNGGQILTNTRSTRRAGQVNLNVADTTTLSGRDPYYDSRIALVRLILLLNNPTGDRLRDIVVNEGANSGVYASASPRAAGRAGSVNITTGQLNIQAGAEAVVNSRGTGQAGNLVVDADRILLDRGTLNAETRSTSRQEGATITLGTNPSSDLQLLYLQNGSQISARAFDNANGGNVAINANNGFVVAREGNNQNNDIIAKASGGNGGEVSITAQDILGLEQHPSTPANGTNDIDVSSEQGLQGSVTLKLPNVDPSRGLVELPTVPVDASTQIAATCPTNSEEADRLGSFIVSGRGGLPPNPTDLLSDDNLLTEWVMPQTKTKAVVQESPLEQPIAEAQGWVRNANGEIQLVAATSPVPAFAPKCR